MPRLDLLVVQIGQHQEAVGTVLHDGYGVLVSNPSSGILIGLENPLF
jgi:hypothetical protein